MDLMYFDKLSDRCVEVLDNHSKLFYSNLHGQWPPSVFSFMGQDKSRVSFFCHLVAGSLAFKCGWASNWKVANWKVTDSNPRADQAKKSAMCPWARHLPRNFSCKSLWVSASPTWHVGFCVLITLLHFNLDKCGMQIYFPRNRTVFDWTFPSLRYHQNGSRRQNNYSPLNNRAKSRGFQMPSNQQLVSSLQPIRVFYM